MIEGRNQCPHQPPQKCTYVCYVCMYIFMYEIKTLHFDGVTIQYNTYHTFDDVRQIEYMQYKCTVHTVHTTYRVYPARYITVQKVEQKVEREEL